MYKDRLPSPSSSHLLSILFTCVLALFAFLSALVYRERKSGELGA